MTCSNLVLSCLPCFGASDRVETYRPSGSLNSPGSTPQPALLSPQPLPASTSFPICMDEHCCWVKPSDKLSAAHKKVFEQALEHLQGCQTKKHFEIAILVDAEKGIILGFTHKLSVAFGYTNEGWLGKNISQLKYKPSHDILEDDWTKFVDVYSNFVCNKRESFPTHKVTLLAADGSYSKAAKRSIYHYAEASKDKKDIKQRIRYYVFVHCFHQVT